MAETPSTGPDNYVELINQQTPSHIEQKVGPEYGKLSFEIGGVVFDMKNNILTILNSPEVKENSHKEIQELKNEVGGELIGEEKEKFIQKLQDLPDYEGSKVQEAVENKTIEIKKIPGRDGYAIYESKVGNLVYITRLDGTRHTNIDEARTFPFFSNAFNGGYAKYGYGNIILNEGNGLWELINKDNTKIDIFTDKYMIATFDAINHMWSIVSEFEDIKKQREGSN